MFSQRALIFFLACLLVFTTALPVHRRGSCPAAKPSASAPLQIVNASSTLVAVASSATATATDATDAPASTVAASSSAKPTSSKAHASSSTGTKTTSKAAASPSATPAISVKGVLAKLFPIVSSQSWTTFPSTAALALSDATLRPFKILQAVAHTYTSAPDGTPAMKAHYPQGSYTFGHNPQGGFSFYAPGPSDVDLTTAKEATFGYSVFFPEGFDFQKGGKLPGLYGGNSPEESVSCSGGSRSSACFSARLMWRTDGAGEFYTYLPPFTDSEFAANKRVCDVAPFSECNPTYGASVGRGSFTFATGQWTTISERVKLNDAGQANGELELFANGKSVVSVNGLILRDSAQGRIRGMQMQTFFGGSSPDFATPKDQDVFFSDFSVAITQAL